MKRNITREKYHVATIFIDHHSNLSYIYLQLRATSDDTAQAKWAFEKYACSHRIKMKHYHADNGRFTDNAFVYPWYKEGKNYPLMLS